MKRSFGILVLAAILGSPGGALAAEPATPAPNQPAASGVVPSSAPADGPAIVWRTPRVDLRADAVTLRVGDRVLRPGRGWAMVQDFAPDGSHVGLRVRWVEAGGRHELYLGLEPSEGGWAIGDAAYLQLSPEVRGPGMARSPIELGRLASDALPGSQEAGASDVPLRASATTDVYTCDGSSDPAADGAVVEAVLEVDGLDLAVSPPQSDLFDIARALLGRGPKAPRDWLGEDGFEGPEVSVACTPAIAATLEDEQVQLVRAAAPGDDPLANLVAEEISPGLFRVSSDGIRDLRTDPLPSCEGLAWAATDEDPGGEPESQADEGSLGRVVAGLDGGIWLFWQDRFVRLGDEATYRWSEEQFPSERDDLEVAPDGTVWQAPANGSQRGARVEARDERYLQQLLSDPEAFAARPGCLTDTRWASASDGALRAYRDGRWQVALAAPSEPIRQVEIAGDDSTWALWGEPTRAGHLGPQLARLGVDGWRLATPFVEPVDYPGAFATLEDGSLVMHARGRTTGLWRLSETEGDGSATWQPLGGHGGLGDVVVSPTGAVWGKVTPDSIVRLEAGGWQEWDLRRATDPGAPRFIGGGGPLAVGQDGALWLEARPMRGATGCHGVYRFDGTTWAHFLDGQCVHSIDVAPNGWVWLRAAPDLGDEKEGPVDLYAIRPDASAT